MENLLENTVNLVIQAQKGDKAALNNLFERYYERILFVVRLRLGYQLRQHLESGDILQEALKRGLMGFSEFRMTQEGAFMHWLSKLVENSIRDKADYFAAKKRSVLDQVPLEDQGTGESLALGERLPGPDLTPSTLLVQGEEMKRLERALAELKVEHREIILQRDLEGLPFHDIGANLGKSEDAARMEYRRAKALLVKRLLQSTK